MRDCSFDHGAEWGIGARPGPGSCETAGGNREVGSQLHGQQGRRRIFLAVELVLRVSADIVIQVEVCDYQAPGKVEAEV